MPLPGIPVTLQATSWKSDWGDSGLPAVEIGRGKGGSGDLSRGDESIGMNREPEMRPYDEGAGRGDSFHETPHLADYWQVVTRRLWLVLLIFGVTTASAIWAVSRQRTFHQASLSLQINDPMERSRGLTSGTRVSTREFFVDPIQSEIEVLRSAPIALEVIRSLGLQLAPVSPEIVRSDLMREIEVDPGARPGRYRLVYDSEPEGPRVRFESEEGEVLGNARVGQPLDAGFLRFVPRPPPGERRRFDLALLPPEQRIDEVRQNLSARPRENTNIIDVSYTSPDPVLAPSILNEAAEALRRQGARKVSVAAQRDVEFIEEQLDSARLQLGQSLDAIREFKESREFTDLSLQERNLVSQIERVTEDVEQLERQRSVLAHLARRTEGSAVEEVDLVSLLAELPEGANPQIRDLVDRIQERQEELRRLLTGRRVTRQHPQAQAFVTQIEVLMTELRDAVDANLRAVENRIEVLHGRLQELQEEKQRFPELESRLETLELQQDLDQETYQFLLSQLYQARIAEAAASPYVDVVDPAMGAAPVQPRGRINVLLGALLGLILGVGAAFFLEYLDRTVRTGADMEALLGIPALGIIPRLKRRAEEAEERSDFEPMLVALDPLDPAAEAYRNLRMNLAFASTEDEPIRSILFTSPGPGEGKSTTAINFAVMVAQQGKRVLLLDADLRRPTMHRALDILREPGLTNVLVGDAEVREAIRPNVLPNLDILPGGPFPPNPSELLSSKTMERLMGELRGKYAQIVIDSPPLLAVTDASVLSVHADGVVLVVRSGETEQRAAERAVEQLQRLGVRILGGVLNEVSAATTEESYYLQYHYGRDSGERKGLDRLREGLSKVRFR